MIELLQRVVQLYDSQQPHEKRRLLNFVCSNPTWKAGELFTEFRQPFDLIANMKRPLARSESTEGAEMAKTEIGGGVRESNPPQLPSGNCHWI